MRYTLEEIKDGTGFRPGAQFEEVTDYNGWPNRETWAVALHINNDQGWQETVLERLTDYVDNFVASDDFDRPNSVAAGDIVKDSVDEHISMLSDAIWEGAAGGQTVNDLLNVVQDLGSLWRVDWTELGRVFLSDLDES